MKEDFERCHHWQGQPFQRRLTPYPTVVERLAEWVTTRPDDPYLTAVGMDGSSEALSFGELDRSSGRLAAWLAGELAIGPGDVVALLPRNDLRSVVTIFGLIRAGASIFFINPAEPKLRLAELLAALPVKVVLAPTPSVAAQHSVAVAVPAFEELGDPAPPVPRAADDCAFFFGTSGSTSTSKIVAQAHYNATINAEALCRHHGLTPGMRVLGCLPIHHVNGLHFTLMASLWAGAHAILVESFQSSHYQDCLQKYRPAITSVVPSILESLTLGWKGIPVPEELRYFVSAAAPMSARLCGSVLKTIGVRVLQGYGLTETTNFSTIFPRGISDGTYRKLMVEAEIPSIGVAVYGNEVAVLRQDGTHAAPGEVGEICMRGHNVMLGYTGNEDATREAFRSGWFHSQDLGTQWIDQDTGQAFFVITGRTKNMAKVMGIAVSLEEMERTLLRLPTVIDVACFSVPDQLLGEAVIAAVVSTEALQPARLNDHLKAYFTAGTLPRRYIQAQVIPRTATGKILRGQLPVVFAKEAR